MLIEKEKITVCPKIFSNLHLFEKKKNFVIIRIVNSNVAKIMMEEE